jgi:hypothetical protein
VADIPQVYTTSVFITPDGFPFEREDPLQDPLHPHDWQLQVKLALLGLEDNYTIAELEGLLPIPVFGHYLRDVNSLDDYLGESGAKQACTAARLNVQAREAGWYSTVYASDEINIKYWQAYDLAENFYGQGNESGASTICWWLALQ